MVIIKFKPLSPPPIPLPIFNNPVTTFNLVFEYQPIVSEISIELRCYKKAESNLLADEKGPYH